MVFPQEDLVTKSGSNVSEGQARNYPAPALGHAGFFNEGFSRFFAGAGCQYSATCAMVDRNRHIGTATRTLPGKSYAALPAKRVMRRVHSAAATT